VDLDIDPNNNVQNTKKIAESIKDRHYKNMVIILVTLFICLTTVICVLYSIKSKQNFGQYIFYDLQLFEAGPFIDYYRGHTVALMIGYIIIFLEEMFFLVMLLIIKNVHNDFNMKGELLLTVIFSITAAFLSGLLQIISCLRNDPNDATFYESASCLVVISKNLLCFIVSVTIPLIETMRSRPAFIPYGETVECCENLELALSTQTACEYFSKYLEIDQIKHNYLLLYMSIKSYELSFSEDSPQNSIMVHNIITDFFEGRSIFKIPERSEYLDTLNSKINYPPKDIFNCLYNLIVGNLKIYYEEFKRDQMYQELTQELLKREIAFERLNVAELN
jgi:hypothetical protein